MASDRNYFGYCLGLDVVRKAPSLNHTGQPLNKLLPDAPVHVEQAPAGQALVDVGLHLLVARRAD